MRYYSKKIEKLLLSEGFSKTLYDQRVKVFSKDLPTKDFKYRKDRLMVIPEWYTFIKANNEKPIYRVEIWPQDLNATSYKLWGRTEMLLDMTRFLEKLHNHWYDND